MLVFGASKGRPVTLQLLGQGTFDESDEHQRQLYQGPRPPSPSMLRKPKLAAF
jgi:hypothetical protein